VTPGSPVQGEPDDSWLQALGAVESAPRHQRKTAGDRALRPVKIGPHLRGCAELPTPTKGGLQKLATRTGDANCRLRSDARQFLLGGTANVIRSPAP
jgi:hypothetical protein